MYKISVPIMNVSVTEETKNVYLEQLRLAQVHRIFLTFSAGSFEARVVDEICEELAWKISFFEENEIEVGVWIGNSIGHDAGLALPDLHDTEAKGYSPLVNLNGEVLCGTRCPTDASFRRDFSALVAAVASVGAKTIMLDDDFRFSLRGNSVLCACDAHVRAIGTLCGEEKLDRETLRQRAFVGKPNKYRSAWMRAQGDSLRSLAREIRAAVDAVDPSVCVMLCSSHSMYDVDGASSAEITKILAGGNPPEMRLHGAPYWEIHWPKPLPAVFEFVRCFSRMARADGVDRLMAEGDVYPRPRYNTPASHLELFDGLTCADGVGGILKYMVDYNASPEYETGYLKHHIRNLDLKRRVQGLFEGKLDCGVETPLRPHLLEDADLDLSVMGDQYPYPSAASMLAMLSIPTSYDGNGICHALFGENARHVDMEMLSKGAFLDGVAATILTERGIDVGFEGDVRFEEGRPSLVVSADGKERSCVLPRGVRFCCANVKLDAEKCLYAMDGDKRRLLLYRYENENGQRFLVCMTDPMAKLYNHEICKGYLMQEAVHKGLEWIAREKMPVACKGNPNLYLLCKRGGKKLAVGLFNCFADAVLEPTVKLDRAYRSIRFVGCEGRLEGDTVYLSNPIPAYEYVAFEVEE